MDIIDTRFELDYELYDTTAKVDGVVSCTLNSDFADISKIEDGTDYGEYISLEHNFSALDGTLAELPDNEPDIAYYSSVKGDTNGEFETNPTITVTFSEVHSMIGFEFMFCRDYPTNFDISWYDLEDALLFKKHVVATEPSVTVMAPVQNFAKVVFEFIKVVPDRYIKLNKFTYGIKFIWGEDTVIDAKYVTESDVVSDKISINTLEFSIYDSSDYFNLGNPEGLHPYIQSGQVVDSYEHLRGEKYYLGRQFIDKFSSQSGKIKFSTVSYMGMLDKVEYNKGDVYTNGITAGTLIADIMSVAGVTNYDVEPEVASIVLYGTLKPGTCRQCMREVLFATQSNIVTFGLSGIKIAKRQVAVLGRIGRDRKISTKATKKDYVSGVSVKYFSYTPDSSEEKTEEISKGLYDEGSNLIKWDEPHSNITTNVGTITESGKYYCVLSLTAAEAESEITISGDKYIKNEFVAYKKAKYLDANQNENIRNYTGTLLNASLAKQVAQAVYKYYEYLLKLDIQYLADKESTLNRIIVENPDELYNDFIAQYEKITYDLTGGYIANATLVGYYNLDTGSYYTSDRTDQELYMVDSDDGGII